MTRVTAGRVTELNDAPTEGTDAVNQNYVDDKTWKTAVQASSTVDITLTPATTIIDGITITEGKRVLLKNQSDNTQNGIYKLSTGNYIRSNDAQGDDSASGVFVYVQEGTINGDKLFHCPDELNFDQGASFIEYGINNNNVTGPISSIDNSITRFDGTTGNVIKSSNITIDDTNNILGINSLALKESIGSNSITLSSPTLSGDYNLTLPINVGTTGQVLTTGTIPGTMEWVDKLNKTLTDTNVLIGNVSNEAVGVAISGDATITNAGVLTLKNSGVTGGSYGDSTTVPSLTVDGKGVVTSASETAIPVANTSTTGLLNNTDWNTFNDKLNKTLTDTNVLIGNVSNEAVGVAISGDATITNTGVLTLNNNSVTVTAGDGLQNGGSVSLGGSVTLDLDNTVIRTTGNQTITDTKIFKNSLKLEDSLSSNGILLQAPNLSGDYNLTLPIDIGSSGQVLSTGVTPGITEWIDPGGNPGGNDTEIQFNNSNVFGGSSSLTWDGSILKVLGSTNSTTITDSVATLTLGNITNLVSLSTGSVIATGIIQGGTITDGTASISGGNLNGIISINSDSILSTGTVRTNTSFIMEDPTPGTNIITIQAPTLTEDLILTFPVNNGFNGQFLSTDGSGSLSWITPSGSGDVAGPVSSTNNALVLFDGSSGKIIKNSLVTLDASNNISGTNNIISSGTLQGISLTDTFATLTGGNLSGVGSINSSSLTATGTVQANTLTDTFATLTGGNLSGVGSINSSSLTAIGTVQANILTDSVATITNGIGTGFSSISSTSLDATSLTDGIATLTAGKLSGIVTPTSNSDATNKAYVDSVAQGLSYKEPVKLASVGNVTLTGEKTIDGVFAGNNDRILLKDQTNGVENGIWIVSSGSWSRSVDMNSGFEAAGTSVLVEQGNINTGSGFVCNNITSSDTVGTHALTFAQYSAGVTITAGAGITKTGNELSVNVDNATIEIFSNNLKVKDSSITSAKIVDNSISTIKIQDTSITNAKLENKTITVTAGDGLQNGGAVLLGSSISLAVDNTIVRTTGTQSLSGVTNFTNVTNASDSSSGSVTISGGLGISKSLYTGENVTAIGNVTGTTVSDGTASLTGGILSNLTAPLNDNDAANKAYVDALITGLKFRDPIKAATVTNLTLSGLQTVDAVPLSVDDRVLVKDQTLPIENGIYLAKSGAWTYAPDYPGGSSAQGFAMLVEFGNVNIGTSFVVKGEDPFIIGTSDIIWVKFASSGSINAGDGLGKSGSTLFVNVDNSTIETVSDSLQVKNNSIDSTKISNTSITTAKLVDGSVTSLKLNDSSVSTIKIQDNSVTNTKLQNDFVTVNSGDGLQNGGLLTLGTSLTLDVDSTVMRITGNQNASGIQIFSNTTESTNSISGGVLVSGGLGVSKNINSDGNIISSGVITAGTLTDGTVSITSGNITGISSFSAGTVNVTTLSDGTATLSGGLLSGLGNPTSDSEAATKGYVDAVAQGIKWKQPVKLTSIGLNDNFVLSGEQTIDGFAAEDGDRVLLKDQWFPRENGIWIVSTGSWSRSIDMAEGSGADGASVIVEQGQINFGAGFVCNNTEEFGTVGNNAGTTGNDLFFVQFTGAGAIIAGDGMSKDGNILSVNVDNDTLGISFDNIYVRDNSLTTVKLKNDSIVTSKIVDSSVTNEKLQNFSLSINPGDGLKNGGSVSLGGSTLIDVDSTVLRISGDQNASGVQSFTNVTESTNINTGSLVVSGGIGVTKNINIGGVVTAIGGISGFSISDGTATLNTGNFIGLDSISGNSLNLTGNITSSSFTDGTLTIDTGSLTNVTNIISNGNISASTISDGTATLSGGNLIGLGIPTDDSHAVNKAYADAIVVTPGDGLTKAGTDLNVSTDNSSLEIIADIVQIKDSGVTTSKINNDAVTTLKIADTNVTNSKLQNSTINVSAGDGLQNGGVVSLGGTTTVNVDSTVFRTSGNQTSTGVKTFTDSTQSINITTGTIVTTGGLGIGKNVNIGGDTITTGTTSSGTLSDNTLSINSGNITNANSIQTVSLISSGTIAGDTLTDNILSINLGNITNVLNITSTGTISGTNITDGTATLSGGKLSGLSAPSSSSDAANKQYVDSVSVGIQWQTPAKVATSGNISLSGLQTIDGIVLTNSDRVLVKSQTDSSQNGIYDSSSGAWSRSSDMNSGSAENFAFLVEEGNTNIGSGWVVTGTSPFTINTSDIIFTQFSSGGAVNTGAGLSKDGSTLNVNVDDTTIEIVANDLQVKDSSIITTKINNSAVTTNKIADNNVTNVKLQNSTVNITAGDGLQNGGLISLGGSISLDVDNTILRTTGDQSSSGIQTFSNTTQSNNSTTGSVIISGGLGVSKNINTDSNINSGATITGSILTDSTLSISSGNITNVNTIGTSSLTATGFITGSTLTDGVLSLNSGNITNSVNITASGNVTATNITDGTATLNGGNLSGLLPPTTNNQAANKLYVDDLVVTPGAGLSKVSTDLNINVDNVTIELLSNELRLMDDSLTSTKLKSNSVTTNKIVDNNVTNVKLQNSTITVNAGDGLQTGGVVSLGGNVILGVNNSVLRTTGAQSASGIQTFSNTTNSSSETTGAIVVTGGVGIGGNTYTTGIIETNDTVKGSIITDGTLTLTSGNLNTSGNLDSTNMTATNTVQAVTVTDSVASLSSGSFVGLVNVDVGGVITISPIPDDRVLFTDNSGQISSAAGLTWDGTTMAATILDSQNITRPNGAGQASLWTSGAGNIDIGLQTVGTIQMGLGPMLKVTSTTSVLQSSLTIQGNLSRQYLDTTINTAANVNYTASEIFNGIIFRDCSGSDRIDTLPTAQDLVNIIPEPIVGSSMEILIRNSSTDLSLLTLAANTGITINENLTIAAGITSRFLIVLNDIIFGQWKATIFASVPKDRVIISCSLTNASSGAQSTRYAQFGPPTSTGVIDYTVLGYSGTIVQMVTTYTSDQPIGMSNAADKLVFSIGTTNDTLDTFTSLSGGLDVIVWDDSYDGTYPATSSGSINIPISGDDRLTIRSIENSSVQPGSMEVRVAITIQLD